MQREFLAGEQSTTLVLNGSHLSDTPTHIQAADVSPRELLHSLRHLAMTNSATQNKLRTIGAYLQAGAGDSGPQRPIQAPAVSAPGR